MLKRKIEAEFDKWVESKSALIVYGARQVGKTYILKRYLCDHFDSVFYLNLHENPLAIQTIIKAIDVNDFFLRLSSLPGGELLKDNTCIFIDEVQEYYTYIEKHKEIELYFDIISESKYISQNKDNRFVLSGSLLRLELNNLITNPMGYLYPLEMYPLDFEEFLWANNVNPELIEIAKKCLSTKGEVPDYIHRLFLDIFKRYILVGGMPKAVDEFVTKNNFAAVEGAHKAIEYYISDDVTKYADDNEKLKVKEIYKLIPTELSNPCRRFIISHIEGHQKNANEILSFSWLFNAGIAIPTYVCSDPIIPLKASSKRNQLKLFHEDVGILTYLLFDAESKTRVLNGEITPNLGAVYENVVAQNLYAHGFSELYYYNSKKFGEVDFLLEQNGEVVPIEVKSGKDSSRHRGLDNILKIENYNLREGLCFYNENTKVEGKIIYLPIYLSTFLSKRKIY